MVIKKKKLLSATLMSLACYVCLQQKLDDDTKGFLFIAFIMILCVLPSNTKREMMMKIKTMDAYKPDRMSAGTRNSKGHHLCVP